MKKHCVSLALVGSFLLPMLAQAGNRYVAVHGSDTTDCSNSASPCATLRHAIFSSAYGDVINVSSGTYKEFYIGIGKTITIRGVGMNPSVIDAQQRGPVMIHATPKETVTLENLRLTGGLGYSAGALYVGPESLAIIRNSVIDNNEGVEAGAIHVDGGSLEVIDSTITSNRATGGSSGYGGGISAGDDFYFQRRFRNVVSIKNSWITENSAVFFGGGVYSKGGFTEIESTTIAGNTAYYGGGVSLRGVAKISTSRIVANEATTGDGGGAHISAVRSGLDPRVLELSCSDVQIIETEISGNSAVGSGGGVAAQGGASLRHSIVSGNSATGGGGISSGGDFLPAPSSACKLSVEASTVDSNEAGMWGGGIGVPWRQSDYTLDVAETTISNNAAKTHAGGIFSATSTRIANSLITGNHAHSFGGIEIAYAAGHVTPSSLRLEQSTISGNTARFFPAMGIDATNEAHLRNSTIAFNRAVTGGTAVLVSGPSQLQPTSMQGMIIANNFMSTPQGDRPLPECFFAVNAPVSEGYNLIGDDTCQLMGPGDLQGTTAVPLDAGLASLQYNGGPTQTHHLLPNSPAIDAGNPTGCVDSNLQAIEWDQRGVGFARENDGNGDGLARCDIGAFEY